MEDWIKFKDQMPPQDEPFWFLVIKPLCRVAVSYTHLTLPTNREV